MSQPLEALDRANEIRYAQAETKRQLRARKVALEEILADPMAEHVERMTIGSVLSSQWRWGRSKTVRVLTRAGVGEMRRVGDLSSDEILRVLFAAKGIK